MKCPHPLNHDASCIGGSVWLWNDFPGRCLSPSLWHSQVYEWYSHCTYTWRLVVKLAQESWCLLVDVDPIQWMRSRALVLPSCCMLLPWPLLYVVWSYAVGNQGFGLLSQLPPKYVPASDWDCVAAVERLTALHYSVDFIFLSFWIMGFIVELWNY